MFRFLRKKEMSLKAPVDGEIVIMDDIPDYVFSQRILGQGIGIRATSQVIYAPCRGQISLIAKTKHALVLTLDNGAEVLIHVGIDTALYKGKGFELLVDVNDQVKAGAPLLRFDLEFFQRQQVDMIVPVIICNSDQHQVQVMTDEKIAIARKTEIMKIR